MGNKHDSCEAGKGGITVAVRNNDIEKAIKILKRKVLDEGLMQELKDRKAYVKPSDKQRKIKSDAKRRQQKMLALRLRHEGY